MNTAFKFSLISAVLSVITLQSAPPAAAHMEPKNGDKMEKCYGIVKAHKNDCASKAAGHSCAGQAKMDADAHEWIKLPTGLCLKISGGSLTEKDAPKQ